MAQDNRTLEQRFSQETLDDLKVKLEDGSLNMIEAGRQLGVSDSSIRRWMNRTGVKRASRSTKAQVELSASFETDDAARVVALEADNQHLTRELRKARQAAAVDVQLAATVEQATAEFFQDDDRIRVAAFAQPAPTEFTAQEFVAHLSDVHYGEVVEPDLAMGLEYSPEIAARRMAYWRDKVIRYADLRPYTISTLHVPILGDMVSGINHADLDVTNARGMMDQALEVASLLYGIMCDFAERFENVRAVNIIGNHGRMHQKPRHKQPFENWDYLMGRVLKQMVEMGLKSDRVTVEVPRGKRHIIDVAGRRIALMHGDGINAASFAGIPFYGMKTKHDALQSLLRALDLPPVHQVSIGHFHQHLHWPGIVVVNGSVKGGDEYVQDTRLAHTPAQQLLQEWHPRYGLTTSDYITLDHVH